MNIRDIMKRGWLALVALAVAATLSACSADWEAGGVTLTPEEQAKLTVKVGDLLDPRAKCETNVATFEWRDGDRKWSDSVSVPFKSSDEEKMRTEVMRENCTNSTTLDMNVQALSEMEIAGFSVAKANPWIGDFLKKIDDQGLNKGTLDYRNKDQNDMTIVVTPETQEVAALANHLILQFTADTVKKEMSVKNWHLPSLDADVLPPRTVVNPKQEGLEVFSVEYTMKGQECVFRWGWNTGDKRAEFLPCEKPSPVPTPTSTTPNRIVEKCKKNCEKEHGKNPAEDPNARGNAPRGGGKNDDPGKGPKSSHSPAPTTPRTDPDPPKASPPAESKPPEVTRPKPADPEPPAPKPEKPGEPGDLVDP